MSYSKYLDRIAERHKVFVCANVTEDGEFDIEFDGDVIATGKGQYELEDACENLLRLLDKVVEKRLDRIHDALGIAEVIERGKISIERERG